MWVGSWRTAFTHLAPLAAKVSWAEQHPALQQQRQEELQARRQLYR